MKIKLLSDLHLEGSSFDTRNICFDENNEQIDVLILAGDISVYSDLLDRHIYNVPEAVQVIYVPGNHEYETKVFNDVIPELKNFLNLPNWHILNNENIVVDNTRFIASTLWSDLKINGDSLYESNYEQAQLILNQQNTKLRLDDGTVRPWQVEDMLKEFSKSKQFIADEVAKHFDGNTIVITHFAPHAKSFEKAYKLNGFWASDMSDVMKGVDIWCHGHIHSSNEYLVGKTKVISNPRGHGLVYDLHQNLSFSKTKTLKIR